MSDLSTVDLSHINVPQTLYRSRAMEEGKRPIVSLKDVRKTYVMGKKGSGPDSGAVIVHALRGVSVDFFEGEYVAIMGASGSG
ncbi:MAG: hypothetical protein ACKO0V_08150, partial [bacterium]